MKRTANDILAEILNCGYLDIEFFLELEESFDVNFDFSERDAWDNINNAIYEVFMIALNNADFDFERHDEKYSIYTNYLDSHLYIDDEEIYNKDELQQAVERLQSAELETV